MLLCRWRAEPCDGARQRDLGCDRLGGGFGGVSEALWIQRSAAENRLGIVWPYRHRSYAANGNPEAAPDLCGNHCHETAIAMPARPFGESPPGWCRKVDRQDHFVVTQRSLQRSDEHAKGLCVTA